MIPIGIRASEIAMFRVTPQQWARLSIFDKKRLASMVLHSRNDRQAQGLAFAIESNNPNAIQGLQLINDLPAA